MKKLIIGIIALSTLSIHAQSSNDYIGSWKSNCFQYQSNEDQGHAIETYSFDKDMRYEFTREIYRDSSCRDGLIQTIEEKGIVKIGQENTNNGFNPANTKEAVYTTGSGKVDLGLIRVNSNKSILKVARGISQGVQNSLLGLFEYKKVK